MEIFHRPLHYLTNQISNGVTKESVTSQIYVDVVVMLNQLTNTSRAWHTKNSKVLSGTYFMGILVEHY